MQRWLLIASDTLENVFREMIHHSSALNVWQAVFVIQIELCNLKVFITNAPLLEQSGL